MSQEDKELLLKDLCGRLSYRVICQVDDGAVGLNDGKLVEIDIPKELARFDADYYWDAYIDDVKPYLRPMSSMTKEEIKELYHYDNSVQRTDFYYSHHIDCRYMIEKGLALEAPKGMYDIKEE